MINDSNADIVWIGLGAPKQEKWMQKMSLEWVMRLLQDPRRLWKRYLVTNVKFIWYVRKENKGLK